MTCRGCAGTGVGQHVGPREAQVAALPFTMKRSRRGSPELSDMTLRVMAAEERGRLFYAAPLALILQEVRDRAADGWWLLDRKPDPAWTCSWCHGTGELQLSVASMERAVST